MSLDYQLFTEVIGQNVIDAFMKEYHRFSRSINYAKSKPTSFKEYHYKESNQICINISKFIRNVEATNRFQSFIDKIELFLLNIEYFNNELDLERKNDISLTKDYKNHYFISNCVDSLRSSIDILSKVISWFFDLKGKEEMGFSYQQLISPLKKIEPKLSIALNQLYRSGEYSNINDFRNSDKHIGKGKMVVEMSKVKNSFSIKLSRKKPLEINELETDCLAVMSRLHDTVMLMVDCSCKYNLGYDSKSDKIAYVTQDGFYKVKS